MFAIIFLIMLVASVMVGLGVVMFLLMRRSRWRRSVATPYGMMMGPTDAELRRTRELHLPTIVVSGRKCLDCGAMNDFDVESERDVAICRQCGRRHRLY